MAESVVLPLLTEVAKPMVKVVVSRVTEEIHFFRKFERELNHLLEKIQLIASTVDSMPDTVVADKAVALWLRKALLIIHDVENLMDLLACDKHRSVVMSRRPKKISRLAVSPSKRVYFRRKMGSWIRRMNTNIEAALKEAHTIHGLKAFVQSAASLHPAATNITDGQGILQQVRQNVDTFQFVGRDSDVQFVVDMLCNPAKRYNDQISSNRLSVIAIIGIGGMGKTTLAKKVYQNEMVQSHFSERIWISDLKDLIIERILNKMIMSLEMGTCDNGGSHIIARRLEENLGGKRYLLVLDDVWNTNQLLWDSMRSALERIGGSNDSLILTTTRNNAVANTMNASVYSLLQLLDDASWLLFKQIAFANWSDREAFALESIGMKIVKKCTGVPLAIKSIAGTLDKKRNPREWSIIEESELWGIPHDDTGVLPSLKLSYDHLSPMLKKCFSLCAFFPKGWWVGKYEHIFRWMALGLIQHSSKGNVTMEDICEGYLNELVSISFLLADKRNELGEATTYKLHDLVYDLARFVAMHEQLYLEASKKENEALDIQHITVSKHGKFILDFLDKKVLENVRSIDVFYDLPRGLLEHVKYLRVLCLQGSTVEVVPESIAKLKFLKYPDLENNPINVLSNCIIELYNLQSLSLYRCKPLFKIPRGLSKLVNLRHFRLSFHFCPSEEGVIGQLSELQTLPPLQFEGGFQISELGCLHHVKGTIDI